MRRSHKILLAAATAAFAHNFLTFEANASTFTWNGGGADDNLTTAANWAGGVAPSAITDHVQFSIAAAPRTTPTTGAASVQYGSLAFLAGAPTFTIGGTGTLVLGAAGTAVSLVNNTVGVNHTFGAPVAIVGGTINSAAGGIVFNSLLNAGNGAVAATNNLTFIGGTSTVSFAGGLSAGGSSINFGSGGSGNDAAQNFSGLALLSTSNAGYTGQMFINGGVVRISNGSALGSGTVTTQLSSGGTGKGILELMGDITVNTNVVTRARSNIGSIMLRNVSGNNTINNVFTNTGGSTFSYDSTAGTLTIGNWNTTATATGRFLILSGAGNGVISNWTPATAATTITINKSGAGNWIMGSGMNNSTGSFVATSVTGGTLTYGSGLGVRMFGSATISNGGAIEVVSPDGTTGEIGNGATPTTIALNNGGTLNASTFTRDNLQLSQTFIGGGTVKVGELGVSGDNIVYIGNAIAAGAGTLAVQGNLNLNRDFTDPIGTAGGIHFDLNNTITEGGGVNDLITVNGNLTLSSLNGQTRIFVNPIAGAFANGSYRLINYTGTLIGSAGDLALTVGAGGISRQTFTLDTTSDPGHVDFNVSGAPVSLTWKGDGAGNAWDVVTTKNWKNGAADDFYYDFDSVTFNDSSANTTVNLGVGVSPGAVTADTASTYLLQGGGSISGVAALTKSGSGTFILANSGSNTFTGAITINSGTLQVGNGGGDGNLGPGSITNNGVLVINKSLNGQVIAATISGSGSIIQRGSTATTLSASNSYTGTTTIEAGALQISNSSALGDVVAGTTVNAGGQLFTTAAVTLNEPLTVAGDGPTAGDGALRSGGATTAVFAAPVVLSGPATFKVDGGATMSFTNTVTGTNTNLTLNGDAGTGILSGVTTLGTGGLTKNGVSTWILANASSSYSGPTTVSAGVLQYGNNTVAGNTVPIGSVTLTGGTVAFNNTGSYAINSTIVGVGTGAIAVGTGGSTVTLTGDLSNFSGGFTTLNGGTNSTLIVPVASNAGSIVISDTNLLGNGQGIIRLTNSNAIANNATIEIQTSQAGGTGRLEVANGVTLNFGSIILHPRNNLTSTILALTGNNTINGPIRVNTGGSTVTFSANAGATLTFTGQIRPAQTGEGDVPGSSRILRLNGDGNGTFAGNITNRPDAAGTIGMIVTKSGTGTWHLTGTNDYVGNPSNTAFPTNIATIVQNGKLILGVNAQAPVLSNTNTAAYTDVQGGKLVFEYAGPSIGPTLNGLLATSFNAAGGFNNTTEKIRSTTATGTLGLGMYDDGVSQATIGYTVIGDGNLDGAVNALDFNAVASHFGLAAGGLWYQGDYNYDGQVNSLDFNAVSANFNQLAPIPTAGSLPELSSLGALVPEPATVGLIAVGAALGMRRRRTN